MPKITESMIHPDLRKRSKSLRNTKGFSLRRTKLLKFLCRFLRGRHSHNMRYAQKYIMRSDGTKLRICVYSPLVPKENVPGVLWIHGGGYSIGIPEQDDHYIRRFVETYGCVVVSPDYMLSLDKPYPAAMDDCYAALIWLSDHGEEYGMRSDQIFVGGNSAGGGLAAAVCLYARDQGVPAIAYQMLLYPMLDDRPTESSTDNDAPVWDSKLNLASWRLYLGDVYGTDDVSIYAAPARATDLTNLPATFSFVGSIEPFFNETVQYIERLENAGIPVHFKVFDGCFHGFDQICYKTDISRKAAIFMKENFDYAVRNYFAEQHK